MFDIFDLEKTSLSAFFLLYLLNFIQVCELDIIFNFEKAYFMLDEFIIGGEVILMIIPDVYFISLYKSKRMSVSESECLDVCSLTPPKRLNPMS